MNKQEKLDNISKNIDLLDNQIIDLSNIAISLKSYRANLEIEVFKIMTGISEGTLVFYKNDKDKTYKGFFSGLKETSTKGLYSFSLSENDKIVVEDSILLSEQYFNRFWKTNLNSK